MDDAQGHWQEWVRALVAGDEQVAGEFWGQYGGRLQGLAEEYLTTRLQRRVSPDDVVQSVCRTFLMRARAGRFVLEDPDSLWRLLCAITLTKIRQQARFHGRQKRTAQRERLLGDAGYGRVGLACSAANTGRSGGVRRSTRNICWTEWRKKNAAWSCCGWRIERARSWQSNWPVPSGRCDGS